MALRIADAHPEAVKDGAARASRISRHRSDALAIRRQSRRRIINLRQEGIDLKNEKKNRTMETTFPLAELGLGRVRRASLGLEIRGIT